MCCQFFKGFRIYTLLDCILLLYKVLSTLFRFRFKPFNCQLKIHKTTLSIYIITTKAYHALAVSYITNLHKPQLKYPQYNRQINIKINKLKVLLILMRIKCTLHSFSRWEIKH